MGDSGPGRGPDVTDEEILAVFRQADDPVLSTAEVESQLNIGHRGTFDRLSQLADEGTLRKKKVSNSAIVWWLEDALRARYS